MSEAARRPLAEHLAQAAERSHEDSAPLAPEAKMTSATIQPSSGIGRHRAEGYGLLLGLCVYGSRQNLG